jgi:hypothetical protein
MERLLLTATAALMLAACTSEYVTVADAPAPGEISESERLTAAKAAPATPATKQMLDQIKIASRKVLRDPDSAQWDRVMQATRPNVRGEPMEVACGHVNSKNAMGGYVGFKPFVFFPKLGDLHVTGGGDATQTFLASTIVKRFCTGMV